MAPKNIYIIGAQSTGKTTLIKALENHFARPHYDFQTHPKPIIITEVARGVVSKMNFDRQHIVNSPEQSLALQKAIQKAQYDAENGLTHDSKAWLISDRSGLDPVVYAKLYVGEAAVKEMFSSTIWKVLEANMKAGLVFLCEAGCAWLIDDGVRLMPKDLEDWMRTDAAFLQLLSERSIEYTLIPKDLVPVTHRVAVVVKALGPTSFDFEKAVAC